MLTSSIKIKLLINIPLVLGWAGEADANSDDADELDIIVGGEVIKMEAVEIMSSIIIITLEHKKFLMKVACDKTCTFF